LTVAPRPAPQERTIPVLLSPVPPWEGIILYQGPTRVSGRLTALHVPVLALVQELDVCFFNPGRVELVEAVCAGQGTSLTDEQIEFLYGTPPQVPAVITSYLRSSEPGTPVPAFFVSLAYAS
jgi:hypothetical protein